METDTIDYSLTLAAGTTGMLMAGGILALSVFIVMFIVIKKRWGAKILPFFIGLFMFSLVRIFVMLAESVLMLVPSIEYAFDYNDTALTVIDCILATVGYMAARWGLAKMISGKYDRQGDVLMSGLGLGFGDAVLYGFTVISNYVWCIAIDNGTLSEAFDGLTQSEALTTFQSLSDLFYAPAILWAVMGASAVIDMILQMLLATTVYGVVKSYVPSVFNIICAVIYAAVVISFQLYDSTSLTSIAVCFLIKVVLFAAAAYYLSKKVLNRISYQE